MNSHMPYYMNFHLVVLFLCEMLFDMKFEG
jgi:hypothetical protein